MIQKISITIVLLFSFLVATIPSSVDAEEPNAVDWINDEDPSSEPAAEESVEWNQTEDKSFAVIIVQLILYTLFILVLIYALIKFLALRQKKLQPNQAVRLMGGTPLGNNKSLQLVKVGEKVYLLGVADQITLIKEFSGDEEITMIEQDLDKQPTLFSNGFFDLSKRKKGTQAEINQTAGFQQLFNQSLGKQKVKQEQLKQDLMKEDDEKEGSSS